MINSRYKPEFKLFSIFKRYTLLLLLTAFFLYSKSLYNVLLIVTLYPAAFITNLFHSSYVYSSLLFIGDKVIDIIPACIAVSAYVFLLILNLTTPMSLKKRIYALSFSFFALLLLNILRIISLILLLMGNYSNFELVHKILWYSLSIVFVILIWFITAYVFKIKNIPVYTDIKQIIKNYKK